ncbi:MAG: hypothetical protein P8017_03915, partial [Deltaproteobacteria bacterium]
DLAEVSLLGSPQRHRGHRVRTLLSDRETAIGQNSLALPRLSAPGGVAQALKQRLRSTPDRKLLRLGRWLFTLAVVSRPG